MLGLFDSGLGGLTVLRRVRQQLPEHDVLFFADQAHVPYGDRSPEELTRLLRHNLGWLDSQGVDAVIMACNTSCAVADRAGWPPTRAIVLDLIESAAIAVQRAGYEQIGVVATAATAHSGSYGRQICLRVPGAHVTEIGAPKLVPLVEAGRLDGPEPRAAVQEYCAQLPPDLDAIVLACTHYPMLDAHFASALGKNVARIDPAIVQAERAVQLVRERGFKSGSGRTRFVTNGDVDAFRRNVANILNIADPLAESLEPLAL
ncbi:MAG: glutamate racemase [Candidatus Eremiobacteraeota bacterium]|nr:glutamate racemase [Candidatus Eremiobacteraeota bacterium]